MSDRYNPTIYSIKLIMAWRTKYKMEIFDSQLKHRVRELVRQASDSLDITILNGRVGKSYVVIEIEANTKHAPQKIAKRLKGRAAKVVREENPNLKKIVHPDALWETGYFCVSANEDYNAILEEYLK